MKLLYKSNVGLLTLGMFLFVSFSGKSQAIFDVIPAGGAAGNTNGTGADPVDDYYNSIRYQVVYTQAELSAAGIQPNSIITNLAWNLTELPGTLSNYSIRMGHTVATNSAAHDASPTIEVKAPFAFVPVMGYNDILFDVNFTWDGVQNLLIEICTGPANPYSSPYGGVQAKTGVTNGSRFIRADGSGLQCGNNTTATATTKPYVRFTVVVPAIPPTPTQAVGVPSCLAGTDIDVVGSPAVDVTWYWQTAASGTSTSTPYTGPYTVFGNGFYYLRAYNAVSMYWSVTSSEIEITNFPAATTPPVPMADFNPSCITTGTTLTMPAAPGGIEYYWQGTNEFGTSTADNALSPYPVSVTGTYYVRAFETASSCWSDASGLLVTVNSAIPLDPVADPNSLNLCVGDLTGLIEAQNPLIDASLSTIFTGGNGCTNGNMFNITTNSNDVTITSLDIIPNTTSTQNVSVYYKAGTYVGSEAVMGAWTLVGTYSISGTAATLINVDIDDFTIPASNIYGIYVNFNAQYTDLSTTYSDSYISISTGAGLCTAFSGPIAGRTFNGTVHYLIPSSATIEWFDAATGGTFVGPGSPFESVGSSVLASPAAAGTYEFYAQATEGGCPSANRSLVTVNVAPVNVNLTAVAVTCNNGNDGTFTNDATICGTAPFTYAVDGGAFGAIPTNLTVGDHDVIVMDDLGGLSGTYTLTIGDAPAPTALVVDAFDYDMVEFSWTAGGSETQWYVEWGLAGFTPGTGTEIGSSVVSSPTEIVTGLDGFTDYDFYVAANCGGPTTVGTWVLVSQTTLCDPILGLGFCESFDTGSPTEACWTVRNENADLDAWDMNYGTNPYLGNQSAMMYTDGNGGANDDWLISPLMTLTNNEILSFYYRVQSAGEPNDFEILISTNGGMEPADFTDVLLPLASYSNTTYANQTIDMSAFGGDCFIAFHVPNGGLDGWRLYIDEVCVDICTPAEGTDGSIDACRLDGTLDLNTVITQGETNGVWEFLSNPGILSGSDINLSLLPDGTYDFDYIVTTACTKDTTTATVTVHSASSAGNDGTLDDYCTNWSSINLVDAMSGSIDLGGSWTNVSGEGNLTGSQWTPGLTTLAGAYDFEYVVSNGFCPNDTGTVTVNLISCLGLDETTNGYLVVYPNPVKDVLTIQNLSIENASLEVFDVQGKLVNSIQLNGVYGNYNLDMNTVERGIYIVKITTNTSVQEVRVVKQ